MGDNMSNDALQRFLLQDSDWRGEWLTMENSLEEMLSKHHYPEFVKNNLISLVVSNILLTATLKFSGQLTLQLMGSSAITLLLSRCNESLEFKSIARFDDSAPSTLFDTALQGSRLVVTLQPDDQAFTQSIIGIEKNTIAEAIQDYFLRSEQIPTYLFIKLDGNKAYGMLLQRLPTSTVNLSVTQEEISQQFQATDFLKTSFHEFLSATFNKEGFILYEKKLVHFVCGCTTEKMLAALTFLGDEEIEELIKEQGNIKVTCEFCNKEYTYER
jgi:molecular chaperone Hsp33